MQEIPRTKIEVDAESGTLFLVTRTDIADDAGTVTHPGLPHRAPYEPGDDPPAHALAAKIAALVWTPEIIAAKKQQRAEQEKQQEEQQERVRGLMEAIGTDLAVAGAGKPAAQKKRRNR